MQHHGNCSHKFTCLNLFRASTWEAFKENVASSILESQTSEARFKFYCILCLIKMCSFQFSHATRWSTLISKEIKQNLGLEKCKYMFAGADLMNPESLKFLRMKKLTVLEVYGLTETTGPYTSNLKNTKKVGSHGSSINGVETKIINTDEYTELFHYKKSKYKVGEVSHFNSFGL